MDCKRYLIPTLAVFVAMSLTEMGIHLGCLSGVYEQLESSNIFRPPAEMEQYLWLQFVIGAVYSFFFVFIFARGHEGKGIIEGVRYGVYITFFISFVMAFSQFATYGIPYYLAWYWVMFGLVQNVLFGIIAAMLYKPKTA